ncbi:MAG: polysaccharide deacetylase family protein [Myxococcales bacterium]|nr:polysaccharide deacetylase family protein [Myxococcales bacterium]
MDKRDSESVEYVSPRWVKRHVDVKQVPRPLTPAWVRSAARHAALTAAGVITRPPRQPGVRCLYLHAVYDDQVAVFVRHLKRLQQIGDFVTTSDLLEMLRGELVVDRPMFHLSFDDGFDNNYRNAFPVLEELEIHATFFVPSAYVGSSDQEAWDLWWLKDQGIRPTRPLDWRQVREMHAAGHEIGSHTRRHVRLSDISRDKDRLEDEIAGSKREIEDELGDACRSIAWPYGTPADFDAAARAAVETAGYDACFSAVRGPLVPRQVDMMSIPRHHFEPEWPWLHVRFFAHGGAE